MINTLEFEEKKVNELAVELDTSGEESEDDLEIDYLDKATDAVTWSSDWTVDSLIGQIRRSKFDLSPKFQRRDAWNVTKKSRFIESLIYKLPIPQIILAEYKDKFIVVDGKQRLLTLKQFCLDIDNNIPFKLRGLKNKNINGLTISDIENKFPELFNNFMSQTIRSVVIKNWKSEDFLYTIFFRLNTGSLSLSPQELRHSLKPGPFLDYADDFSQQSIKIKELLNLDEPDARMRDMDLVIRYFAFKNNIENYTGKYKSFLDATCDIFNKNWNSYENIIKKQSLHFEQTIDILNEIFDEGNIFRRWDDNRFETRLNRAIFDIFMHYLSDPLIHQILIQNKEKLLSLFKELCNNALFIKSISSSTNSLREVATRFYLFGSSLNERLGMAISIPANLLSHYKSLK